MSRDDRIYHWLRVVNGFTDYYYYMQHWEINPRVEAGEAAEAVLDARIQKAILLLIKERLDANPGENKRFKETTDWKILNQLLAAARLKELMRVKIAKVGKSNGLRYHVNELGDSFYGRKVLTALGFSKQRFSLTKEEFERVQVEFQKIKLSLPESVEPTTTEKFFAGEFKD
jgi:hypothetical protein